MEANVGIFDMVLRFILVMVTIIIGTLYELEFLYIVTIYAFITGISGFSPIYSFLGKSTRENI